MNKENLHYDRIGCVLLLSLFIFILSFFLCDIPKKFSVPFGLICFLFELAAVTGKGNSISSCIFYTILSPLAFVVLYLWILYLLNHIETLPVSFRHTVIFAILAIIAVDFIYYKLVLCPTSVDTINSISTSDTIAPPEPEPEPEPEVILSKISNNSQENFISRDSKTDRFSQNIKSDIFIDGLDVYFEDAARFVIEKQRASVGILQRLFKIGYNRAARIMDQLSDVGVVGPEVEVKSRKVLMSMEDFEEYLMLYPQIALGRIKQESAILINTQCKNSLELATVKEYSAFVEKLIGKPVDYSKDGKFLTNLQNMIITQVSEQTKFDLLDDLIRYNSFSTLRLILFDKSQFNFFNYKDVPNLIGKIIFDSCKLNVALNWICAEMKARTKLFLEHHVKNIFEYNEISKSEGYSYLPIYIIIIDELYGFGNICSDNLEQILLDSGRRGFFVIGFSRMNLKNLSLGSSKFLLKHYIDTQVSGMFSLVHDTSNDTLSSGYDSMEGHDFEYFCADLLKHNGFRNVSVTQGSGDQGIDILAEKEGVQYGIQCKCYASDIGNKAVQEAFAGKVFYNCHVAAVLTNQHFTKSAIELAQVNKVLLWDREKLDSFIKSAK